MTQSLNEDLQPPPLIRKVKLNEIENEVSKSCDITAAEREGIRDLLDLRALDTLNFTYRLREDRGGKVHISGRLEADVTQTCVVSLEPIPSAIDVPVAVEFWPVAKIEILEKQAEDPDQAAAIDWPELIEAGAIDLGRLIYETLATSLDPYPKKAGARLQWADEESGPETAENGPFAALKRLKDS